ncbi:MAG: hypothetical protein AAF556_11035 [Pseudomonadota bacterium]
MANRLLFTLTTGRTGTGFLYITLDKILGSSGACYHERIGPRDFGVHTPDLSHTLQFNHFGNNEHVQQFWRRKFAGLGAGDARYLVEASHLLAKAGLIENLPLSNDDQAITILKIIRNPLETAISFAQRLSYANQAGTWLFGLHPKYPLNVVPSDPYLQFGSFGVHLWNVHEMRARSALYWHHLEQRRRDVQKLSLDITELTTIDGVQKVLSLLGWDGRVKSLPEKVNANAKAAGSDLTKIGLDNAIKSQLPVFDIDRFIELGSKHAYWRAFV